MKQNSLLYISDNDFYFSANELNTELQECKVDNCVYMRILKLFNIHIFYRVSYKNNFSKLLSFYHQERSDKIISISSTFNNVLKKFDDENF